MQQRRQKQTRPDEMWTDGRIAMARFGKNVWMKNLMSQAQVDEIQKLIADSLPQLRSEINEYVESARKLVVCFDPLQLLQCAYFHLATALGNKPSESDHGKDETLAISVMEYVQSVLVSTPPGNPASDDSNMGLWHELTGKIDKLYEKLTVFHMALSAAARQNDPRYDPELDQLRFEAQMLWCHVRGSRYSNHDIPHLRDFLFPHEEILKQTFGVSVEQLLNGLAALQFSLTQGMGATLHEMKEFQAKVTAAVENKLSHASPKKTVKQQSAK